MSARSDSTGIIVGGEPRIDLLPPEIKAAKQARKSRGLLGTLVIAVLLLCGGGYVFATSLAIQSQDMLVAEQTRTEMLLQEQLKYADARAAANQLAAAKDARLVASATEILWREYLVSIQGTLPESMVITAFVVDSISAYEVVPEVTVPLQKDRVATLSLTASSPDLVQIDQWLVALRALRGHADSTVTAITLQEGVYVANVTLNVNADAFEKRFFAGYVPGGAVSDASTTKAATVDNTTSTEGGE